MASGIKDKVAILGMGCSKFGERWDTSPDDLTGAGDLFAAGFLHGYIKKLSIKECLKEGTQMSSRVIQQIGARL